ncbi:MAG TPA: 50S ribosomal protein L9 [Candidatus Sulfotelmatobacter sp.]|nr:50S ribosomal protein L9 [Candidatus Sulfotelmatobacter sp.]
MKVIILEDDRVENVADGYARNFLLPRGLAVSATPKALVAVGKRSAKKQAEVEKKREETRALAEKLAAAEVTISVDAGEGGKLFGSVTAADVAKAVKAASGIEVDKRKITLAEPIKLLGEYHLPVKLFQDISASLKLTVAAK